MISTYPIDIYNIIEHCEKNDKQNSSTRRIANIRSVNECYKIDTISWARKTVSNAAQTVKKKMNNAINTKTVKEKMNNAFNTKRSRKR